jgi:hypothetical protein
MIDISTQSDESKYVLRYKCSMTKRWRFLDIANGREVSNPMEVSMYLTEEQVKKVIPIAREKAKARLSAGGVQDAIDDIEAVSLKQAIRELHL